MALSDKEIEKLRQYHHAMSERIRLATVDTLHQESEQEKQKRIAHLLRPENYGEFFMYYFGGDENEEYTLADSPCAPFHIQAYTQLYRNKNITQINEWFRGAAKSVHADIGFPIALKQSSEMRFMLLVGINEERAIKLLSDIHAQLTCNARLIADFGVQDTYGDWAEGNFKTADGVRFMAVGIEQPFRGLREGAHRLDYVVIDDCEDRKVALNSRLVRERGEKILGDLKYAFGKWRKRLVIANNNITNSGILSFIKKKMDKSPFLHVNRVNFTDENGRATWSERYSEKDVHDVLEDAKADYYACQRELYNNPIEEGKIIKETWIASVEPLPFQQYDVLVGHWDLAYSSNACYKAYALIGVRGSAMDVLSVFCRQCDTPTAIDWHYDLVCQLGKMGVVPINYYDATAAQEAVFFPAFAQRAAQRKIYSLPLPDKTQHTDKMMRMEAGLTGVLYNKTLRFSAKMIKECPDWAEAKKQLLGLEKGSNIAVDFPDTLERAVFFANRFCGSGEQAGYSFQRPVIGHRKYKGW